MPELLITQYKDAYSVSIGDRMLIYGLTIEEAKDFRSMYFFKIPDGQFTPAYRARSSRIIDRKNGRVVHKRGRKLLLESYLPTIEAYLNNSRSPTIKELDDILLKEGASYSSTTSIKNMLHSLGREIPWKVPAEARVSVSG